MAKKKLLDQAIQTSLTSKPKPAKREKQTLKPVMVLGIVLFLVTVLVTLLTQLGTII